MAPGSQFTFHFFAWLFAEKGIQIILVFIACIGHGFPEIMNNTTPTMQILTNVPLWFRCMGFFFPFEQQCIGLRGVVVLWLILTADVAVVLVMTAGQWVKITCGFSDGLELIVAISCTETGNFQ